MGILRVWSAEKFPCGYGYGCGQKSNDRERKEQEATRLGITPFRRSAEIFLRVRSCDRYALCCAEACVVYFNCNGHERTATCMKRQMLCDTEKEAYFPDGW